MENEMPVGAMLSDAALLIEVKRLATCERQATARLIAALGEVDARRLYLGEGCSSLFTYCTQVLHLSEHAAYGRIEAARAARKWPIILDLLADGSAHLTAIGLLAPHLTDHNHREVLAAARHKTKREIEEIVAALRPQPAVPSTVRKLPAPKIAMQALPTGSVSLVATADPTNPAPPVKPTAVSAASLPAPARLAAAVRPLAPECYKIQCSVSREVYDKLREAQALLRHQVPNGDVAEVFDRALTCLLKELHRSKHAAAGRPRAVQVPNSKGRHIPAAVKRAVWQRDGGRCAFQGSSGRCTERGFLEYHHVVPFADRGATTADNLELRCRAHNGYEAQRWFGASEQDLSRETAATYGEFIGEMFTIGPGPVTRPLVKMTFTGDCLCSSRPARRQG